MGYKHYRDFQEQGYRMMEPIHKYFRLGTLGWMSFPTDRYDQWTPSGTSPGRGFGRGGDHGLQGPGGEETDPAYPDPVPFVSGLRGPSL